MTTPIVIIGCGGFGREVHDIIDAINQASSTWELIGYVDDDPAQTNLNLIKERGSRLLGSTDWLSEANASIHYVIGIGSGAVRRSIDVKLSNCGMTSAILIHPTATLGYSVRIGEGSIICAGVRATTNIALGRHVHLNLNSTVGHDSTLGDYVTVNPLVAISGWVSIGSGSMLGTHSAVLQQLSVGADSVVGAGACVVKDVPDHAIVKGVPAR
jgi:sugar O-acyltransferase (sialic acid O-acetyltransferase NeuD family)